MLSGSEYNSLIGHLNNCVLGSREEWRTAIPIIGKKAVVIHISQIRVYLFLVFSYHLDNILVFVR